MWFGTEGGFSFFENGQLKSISMADGLPNSWVNCMLAINEREMLIGTRGGLAKYNWQTKVLQEYKNEELTGKNIASLIKSNNGDILIAINHEVYSMKSNEQISYYLYLSKLLNIPRTCY